MLHSTRSCLHVDFYAFRASSSARLRVHAQPGANLWARAIYKQCHLNVFALQDDGKVSLACTVNTAEQTRFEAGRPLNIRELEDLRRIAAGADLCGGGHIGLNLEPQDGVFERLTAGCGDGRVAILVTSGNPTFEADRNRAALIKRLWGLKAELERRFKRTERP